LVVVILDGRVGPTVDEMVQLGYFATWMRWYMDTFGLMHLIDEPNTNLCSRTEEVYFKALFIFNGRDSATCGHLNEYCWRDDVRLHIQVMQQLVRTS
jgi:hypothetical protein